MLKNQLLDWLKTDDGRGSVSAPNSPSTSKTRGLSKTPNVKSAMKKPRITPSKNTESTKKNETITKSQPMDISTANVDLVKPSNATITTRSRRVTIFEPQKIDETLKETKTTNRRKTMNFSEKPDLNNSPITPIQIPQIDSAKKITGNNDSITALFECLCSYNHILFFLAGIAASTPVNRSLLRKTLLHEYETTFSGTKTVAAKGRRSMMDISMDIINQRVENINKMAKLNNSTIGNNSLMDISDDKISTTITEIHEKIKNVSTTTNANSLETATPRPTKRKLFDPNSNNSFSFNIDKTINMATDSNEKTETIETNTTKKAVTKRSRDDDDEAPKQDMNKKKNYAADTLDLPTKNEVKNIRSTRRSTMFFQPADKITKLNGSSRTFSTERVLVFTNMHQAQSDLIKEVNQTTKVLDIRIMVFMINQPH